MRDNHQFSRATKFTRRIALSTVSAGLIVNCSLPTSVLAQQATPSPQAAQLPTEEIVVTGSRVVRDGYEAPTPVTVIGAAELESAALPNIADVVNKLPALGQPLSTKDGGSNVSMGLIGQNSLNLRGLGVERTLTLLDGHRFVGASTRLNVDVNSFPQNLITRVDVVTGGASSAYGSDAVAGVVNFVLDKEFVGVKGNLQGHVTTYGDNRSVNASLAAGTGFASDRGHILLSADFSDVPGVYPVSVRKWNQTITRILANPAYVAGNGQPRFLYRTNVGTINSAQGGVVTTGPLAGLTFTQNGEPFQFPYGYLTSDPYSVYPLGVEPFNDPGQFGQSLEDGLNRQAAFARVSYDVTDNINVYAQFVGANSHAVSNVGQLGYGSGSPAAPTRLDNAFLPASVRARMVAAGVTSIQVSSNNRDTPPVNGNFYRRSWSYAAGASGSFDALDTDWQWDAQAQFGLNRSVQNSYVINKPNLLLATDAVVNPATNAIVCRSTLSDPTNGCIPYNVFGWGHNGAAAVDFITGTVFLNQRISQETYDIRVAGNPFSTWAGQVSVAVGVEHRKEAVSGEGDPLAAQGAYSTANYLPSIGSYKVTEGFFETVVPLATNTEWAELLELNGAVRATNYSNSGYVTTWKIGASYQPITDIRFRVNRSQDIRAPNLAELFAGATRSNAIGVISPETGRALTGVASIVGGNRNLVPEVAQTLGFGAVIQPRFIPGFQAAADFFDISINNAISSVTAQNTLNLCFEGRAVFCQNIARDGAGNVTAISTTPINFVKMSTRGLDLEASYRTELSSISEALKGDVSVRALATHFMYARTDNGFGAVFDSAGNNSYGSGGSASGTGTPYWRFMFSADYSLDSVRFSWTGRAISSGHYSEDYIVCSSNCPVSTTTNPTIDYAHIAARFYHDVSFSYKFLQRGQSAADAEAYFTVSNLLNTDPPVIATAASHWASTNIAMYDALGRVFHAGIRFQF